MGRKLASVQVVWNIEPIDGADRVELAYVLGWKCVVPKGEFKKNDLAVYFEIDSFLPIEPRYEFLRKSSFKHSDILGDGFKLRTAKLCGVLSQGLLLPLNEFEEIPTDVTPGTDVTKLLRVRKWDIEERATTGGTIIGTLPNGVPHTDETRIQTNPDLLCDFNNRPYYITTKMDGSSHSVCIDEDAVFHVCGHNYEYKNDGKCSFWDYVIKHDVEAKARKCYEKYGWKHLVIQGEFCAPGIASNRVRLNKPEWYIFTIIVDGMRLDYDSLFELINEMGLTGVPVEETDRDLNVNYPTLDDLIARSEGEYPNGGAKEGIVIRTIYPFESNKTESGYLSIKVINPKYLLKNDV